jgi:hypothetical protein
MAQGMISFEPLSTPRTPKKKRRMPAIYAFIASSAAFEAWS